MDFDDILLIKYELRTCNKGPNVWAYMVGTDNKQYKVIKYSFITLYFTFTRYCHFS